MAAMAMAKIEPGEPMPTAALSVTKFGYGYFTHADYKKLQLTVKDGIEKAKAAWAVMKKFSKFASIVHHSTQFRES